MPVPVLVVILSLIIAMIVIGPSLLRDRRERKKVEELRKRVQKAGTLFRHYSYDGVNAICAEEDFQKAYRQFYQDVKDGKRKPTEKVVLMVKPTFTFYSKTQAECPMHLGYCSAGEQVIQELIEQVIGTKLTMENSEYGAFEFNMTRNFCAVYDTRLFVPFAGGIPNADEQVKFYGKKTLEEMREYFLSKLPTPTDQLESLASK